jgi:hypothetical protein
MGKTDWNDATKGHPTGVRLLVVKHYLDQKFDVSAGGYRGPFFRTPSFIDLDISFREGSWEKGGVVTHYIELPEMPE